METRRHRGAVHTLSAGLGGTVLATAGEDGVIRLWDVASRELLRLMIGHSAPIHQLAFSPDGTVLASAGADGTVRL
jgi:WD40 repeat protein